MPEPVYFPTDPTKIVGVSRRVTRLERRQLTFLIVDHLKIFGDRVNTKVRARAFAWVVSDDIVQTDLDIIGYRAYVTTVGGACTTALKNETEGDTLCTLTIPAGATTAYTATTIDETVNFTKPTPALEPDPEIYVPPTMVIQTIAGGGTKGLGVYLYYGLDKRP
jgi:hypothetical protein